MGPEADLNVTDKGIAQLNGRPYRSSGDYGKRDAFKQDGQIQSTQPMHKKEPS